MQRERLLQLEQRAWDETQAVRRLLVSEGMPTASTSRPSYSCGTVWQDPVRDIPTVCAVRLAPFRQHALCGPRPVGMTSLSD